MAQQAGNKTPGRIPGTALALWCCIGAFFRLTGTWLSRAVLAGRAVLAALAQRLRQKMGVPVCRSLAAGANPCAMHSYNNAYAYKLFKLLGLATITFIACPTENIHLQGRFDSSPKRRGLTRVKKLHEAGLNVCFVQDSMSGPWYPVGNGNPMIILDAGIHIAQMMSIEEIDNALDRITINGAQTLNILPWYGIEEDKPANVTTLNAKGGFEAVCNRVFGEAIFL